MNSSYQPTKEGDFYLYRHIRLDNNQVFYVGIGKVYLRDKQSKGLKKYFTRAYSKGGRNQIWKRIVNKTNYKVEILFINNNLQTIKELEISLIEYYGRIDKKTGTLACLTDGGDGTTNISEEGKLKISNSSKIRASNQYGSKNTNAIEVFVYGINGEYINKYPSLIEAQVSLGLDKYDSRIFSRKYTSIAMYHKGYQWSKAYLGSKIAPKIMSESKKLQYGNNNKRVHFSD